MRSGGVTSSVAATALILAGGLGTRLRGVVADRPKVLAPVSGRPFLAHLLDRLAVAGVSKVVLSLGHMADQVVTYCRDHPVSGMTLDCVVESEPLGTGGAIAFARDRLEGDNVLILNGDTMPRADIAGFVRDHCRDGRFASILCASMPDVRDYGRIETDGDGFVSAFREKDPAHEGGGLVSCGVYVFSAACLDRLVEMKPVSLEQDFLAVLPAGSIFCDARAEAFVDIGTAERFADGQTLVPEYAGPKSESDNAP